MSSKKTTSKQVEVRNILAEANQITSNDRPAQYGPVRESFDNMASLTNLTLNAEEKASLTEDGAITGSIVIKVLQAVKLIRNTYSPENPDHRRDGCGYLKLEDDYRREQLG